jgi:hypothetical protein
MLRCDNDDIFIYLQNFLCPVDYNSFRYTCKRFLKLPPHNIINIILEKLSAHVTDAKQFLLHLSKYNCVLSGSFVLSCLYDNLEYSDIDVFEYIPYNKNKGLLSEYYCSEICDDTTKNSFRIYLRDLFGDQYKTSGPYSDFTDTIRTYSIFQHICVPLSPLGYIKSSFDMDICKVAFDGKTLFVRNWDKLIERKDIIRPNGYIMLFYHGSGEYKSIYQKRLKKYTEKGFQLEKHKNHDIIIEYMEELAKEIKFKADCRSGNLLHYVVDGTLNLELFDKHIEYSYKKIYSEAVLYDLIKSYNGEDLIKYFVDKLNVVYPINDYQNVNSCLTDIMLSPDENIYKNNKVVFNGADKILSKYGICFLNITFKTMTHRHCIRDLIIIKTDGIAEYAYLFVNNDNIGPKVKTIYTSGLGFILTSQNNFNKYFLSDFQDADMPNPSYTLVSPIKYLF